MGVGDGPFSKLGDFDDQAMGRAWDNVQSVVFSEVVKSVDGNGEAVMAAFAMHALMELPDHVREMRKRGLIRKGVAPAAGMGGAGGAAGMGGAGGAADMVVAACAADIAIHADE
mgnify:CR=1 FL=1